ncbi:C4-dicarboxylate ABC transporter permease [Cohnella kolymensis]|uniref:C4-dicarboxylate ABC transporter permease n=1 Tax=Cohnella kolymensis TaxID=1590652 RepID=A0ABR5A8I3_9BACL|nr:TRAP transporter large permease [Cohnella kolymensis]KIL37366.1 C4-dicarboxylate ABC transporter permease [Cohnella kolymensis]
MVEIVLIGFVVLLFLQIPIPLILGITTIIYIFVSHNMDLLPTAPQRLYSGLENFGLLAIPLFMLAGELMNSSGLTTRLIRFAKVFVGHFRGGLAYVNVVANMFLAAILGSAIAQTAVMSKVMVPAMEEEGYKREFAAATTASAALLGPIIPPSMLFVIYAVGSGTSVGRMFLAGIMPGLLLAGALMGLIAYLGYKHNFPRSKKESFRTRATVFVQVLPALSVPVIIIGGITSGVFTATESAAIACAIAAIAGFFIYKELKISYFPKILVNTAISTAAVTLLIAMATLFGWVLTFEQIPQHIVEWMASITDSPWVFLLLINIFLLINGIWMDELATLVILLPIFMPLVDKFGIDPVHFGIIVCINSTIGLLTPPVGAGLFIASSVGKVKLETLIKEIWPFVAVSIVVLMIITYWPQFVLWIPNMFGPL